MHALLTFDVRPSGVVSKVNHKCSMATIQRKILMGENFPEFDKLQAKIFPLPSSGHSSDKVVLLTSE